MPEPAEANVDELRRRGRRRLVGAIVLALAAAVLVPMLLESEPKPLGEDVSVRIPPVDEGKFVNRLTEPKQRAEAAKAAQAKSDVAKAAVAKSEAPAVEPAKSEPATKTETAAKDMVAGAAAPSASDETKKAAEPARGASDAKSAAAPAAPATSKAAEAPAGKTEPAKSTGTNAKAADAKSADAMKLAAAAPGGVAAPAATGSFVVQLAAFADDKGANSLANKLKRAGYTAYTEPLTTSRGTLWRVRVGPYATREAALAARDQLKSEGYSGIVPTAP